MNTSNLPLSERTGLVSFQGALGANSHLACQQALPKAEVLPCVDFDSAFEAVVSGQAELAMIPVENSTAGRVADIHRLLPGSGLHIIGEHFLPITHYLVGQAGSKLADISEAYSHEQALSQCRDYLLGQGIEAVKFSDTAAAAKWVSEAGQPHQAAICAPLAAKIYNLEVLAKNINDSAANTTRFIILSRAPETPSPIQPCLTSLLFRTKSEPASLYKALTGFATLNLNITKLESYMVGDRFDVAQFYIDVAAHKDSEAFAIAYRDLQYFCVEDGVRLIGCYPAHSYRDR